MYIWHMYPLANQWRKCIPEDHHPSEHMNMTMHMICPTKCGICPKHRCQSFSSEMDRMCTCKTDVIMQGYGVCPSMNMSKQQAKVSPIVPIFYIICLWSWPRSEETKWREHYEIPRCPHKMEVGRHFVLQLVDGVCPNEICRSEREISWP